MNNFNLLRNELSSPAYNSTNVQIDWFALCAQCSLHVARLQHAPFPVRRNSIKWNWLRHREHMSSNRSSLCGAWAHFGVNFGLSNFNWVEIYCNECAPCSEHVAGSQCALPTRYTCWTWTHIDRVCTPHNGGWQWGNVCVSLSRYNLFISVWIRRHLYQCNRPTWCIARAFCRPPLSISADRRCHTLLTKLKRINK